MQLDTMVTGVTAQLTAAASLGDDRVREVAATLANAAEPAVRLALLQALSAVADEASAALLQYPGAPTLSLGLDGDRVRVDVHVSVAPEPAAAPKSDDTEASARISLRLSESLKASVEQAAAAEGISVNT